MVFIYALQLQEGKYYVGKTNNPQFRLDAHFNSNGSSWTKKYKPIKLFELIPNCDNFDEDKYTLKYMEKYGINNVRGGTFCEVKLSEENKNTIKKMLDGSTDKCYICGEKGHFARNCSQDYDEIAAKELDDLLVDNDLCFRCYRKGHYASDCYAKTTITGDEIEDSSEEIEVFCCSYCDKEFDTLKGATCHENLYCKNKNNKIKQKNVCSRCDREGHYASSCYATKHVNGYYLK